jgi:hypothetical protein
MQVTALWYTKDRPAFMQVIDLSSVRANVLALLPNERPHRACLH